MSEKCLVRGRRRRNHIVTKPRVSRPAADPCAAGSRVIRLGGLQQRQPFVAPAVRRSRLMLPYLTLRVGTGLVDCNGAHQASFPRLLTSRRMKIAAIARIGP